MIVMLLMMQTYINCHEAKTGGSRGKADLGKLPDWLLMLALRGEGA